MADLGGRQLDQLAPEATSIYQRSYPCATPV
jgi:hypothetical protein